MTDSIPPVQFPIIEMNTSDEVQYTLFKAALSKQVPDVDAFLSAYEVKWRVAIRPASGSQPMMCSVVIWSATPKPPPPQQPKETGL